MIKEDAQEFKDRIKKAGEYVFGNDNAQILLDEKIMREFGLGLSSEQRKPNSHLSLLSMVDAWYKLGINPYENMICQTPPFKLRLGIVEYLFKNPELLEESLETALYDKEIRGDDLEFHTAVNNWSTVIENGDTVGYRNQFDNTKNFFKNRLEEGMKKSSDLIKKLNNRN